MITTIKRAATFAALTCLAVNSSSKLCMAQDGRSKFIEPASVAETTGDDALSFSLRAGTYSSYVWRGLTLYDQPSFQPSGGAFYDLGKYGTFGGSIWMQVPLGDNPDIISGFDENGQLFQFERDTKFFELDATLSYDVTVFDIVTLSAGHIWYTDPGYGDKTVVFANQEVNIGETSPDTAEFYAGVTLDIPLQPTFTFYHDYRVLDYNYFSLGLSHTIKCAKLSEQFNLTPFVTFGFGDRAADDIQIYNKDGLVHVNLGVTTSLPVGDAEIKPVATYVFGTDGEENGERAGDKFYLGVDIAYDFAI